MELYSEKALIGSMILDPACIDMVRQYVKGPGYFQNAVHGKIFGVLLKMAEEEKKIDVATVYDEVRNEVSVQYLTQTINLLPTAAHAEEYAKNVRDNYMRSLIRERLRVFNPTDTEKYPTMLDVLNYLEAVYRDSQAVVAEEKEITVAEIVEARMKELQEERNSRIIPTGYLDLDRIINGLEQSELVVVAARPGMGKTALALNIGLNLCHAGKKVIFFTLEMSKERLVDRLISIESQVPARKIKNRRLDDQDREKLARAVVSLSRISLIIRDKAYSVTEMRAEVAKEAAKGPVGLVVVDYLQLISDGKKHQSRNTEIGFYSRQLVQLAKDFNTTVLCLSQLSRKVEDRTDKRPRLSDLYESGMIEANIDKALLLYREEYYKPDTKSKGITEIGVGKNRDGDIGRCEVLFTPETITFRNLLWEGTV